MMAEGTHGGHIGLDCWVRQCTSSLPDPKAIRMLILTCAAASRLDEIIGQIQVPRRVQGKWRNPTRLGRTGLHAPELPRHSCGDSVAPFGTPGSYSSDRSGVEYLVCMVQGLFTAKGSGFRV